MNLLSGLELEGTPPPTYVKELISELEQQLITFRRQMEVADKQMQSSPKLLTEQGIVRKIKNNYFVDCCVKICILKTHDPTLFFQK
jgi:hypothetical protein